MLTSKVMLDFPQGSQGPKWVEIGDLAPVIETGNIVSGDIFDSSLSVAEHPEFQRIQAALGGSVENVPESHEGEDSDHLYAGPFRLIDD
jgi:hypothetical protein